ncbi:MAG: Phage terminase large subunit [Parcubacteria group bacterium ADurb.Bin216]|nr:MAG: Phage terminase large subunit [Parcubacteria group bacterium ADurb.Bin216]
MEIKLQASRIFQTNYQSKARVTLNEGSSRSSKTYSIMQMFLVKMLEEQNKVITVARKTLPALKGSAYRDWLEILNTNKLYNPNNHNKSELIYKIGTNEIEFISVDNFDKVKGRKRDYLFCNEANELSWEDYNQLALRTNKQIYLDLNPSHTLDHWIETKIKTKKDLNIIHSTYKDNPFLPQAIIDEIEDLQNTDQNLWRIYGLGIMGILEDRIYTHFKLCDELPEQYDERVYGLDFGFNHPTSLVEVRMNDNVVYAKEIIYESHLTNAMLIDKMNMLEIPKTDYIYADSEDSNRIEEIRMAGYCIYAVEKGKDSVKAGIDNLKSKQVFITKDSLNAQKELNSYSWKKKPDGTVLDEPIKFKDDFLDSLRYATWSIRNKQSIIFI